MALIANNGTGKSSLLKIIAGTDIADDGSVTIRSGIKIGYLAQEPDFNQSLSIEELINTAHTDVMKLIHDYEDALVEQSENFNEQTQKRLEDLSAQMDEANAWDYDLTNEGNPFQVQYSRFKSKSRRFIWWTAKATFFSNVIVR